MSRATFAGSIVALLFVALCPLDASANGQSTHLWITDHALEHVPEGPLREFLTRPELRKMLDNGTMFPDGGYPLGDPYAEIAHWEPFQGAYLDWIVTHYDPPYEDEAAEHLAFMFGMASHGMADQVFDSLYGERVKVYDGAIGDFDTASDLILMSEVGGMMAPSDWVPYAVFDELYDQAGYDVDPAVMMDGQNLLRIAVNSVGIFSQMPTKVEEAAAPFPWGRLHLLDAEVEGSPPCEGELVARYWRVLWALAHEQSLPGPVLGSLPPDGGTSHPVDASSLESWVTLVFARGLEDAPLTSDAFVLESEGGTQVPLAIWHYYGQSAHVVHLQPQVDLEPDTIYRVAVMPGVQTIHGEALDAYELRFSTGALAPDPVVPAWPPDHDPSPVGETSGGESGESSGGDTSSDSGPAGDSDTSSDSGPASEGGDSVGSAGEAGVAAESGCGCRSERRGGAGWLALGSISLLRRRRARRAGRVLDERGMGSIRSPR